MTAASSTAAPDCGNLRLQRIILRVQALLALLTVPALFVPEFML